MFLMDFLVAIFRKVFRRQSGSQKTTSSDGNSSNDNRLQLEQRVFQPQLSSQRNKQQPRRSLSFPGERKGSDGGRRRRAIDMSSCHRQSFQQQREIKKVKSIQDSYSVPPNQNRLNTIQYSKSTPNLVSISEFTRNASDGNTTIFAKDSLDIYQTINIIKQSGVKIVYTALDSFSKEVVVIKLVQSEQCGADVLKQFFKETRILHSLSRGDGVVKLLGTIEEHPYQGLVLEYCRFQSLRNVLEIINGPLSEQVIAIDILQGLLTSLAQIHSSGIIHGTIEPEHILLNDSMCVRVCGFDNAVETVTELPYYSLGYLPYTAPEILSKPTIDQIFQTVVIEGMDECELPQYNTRADVWSVGILVVELLLGYNPFLRCIDYNSLQTQTAEFLKRGFKRGGLLEMASNDAKDFICNCLQLDPQKRPNPEQLLRHNFVIQRDVLKKQYLNRTTLAHVIQERVQSTIRT
eukprot:TRINITY_DN14474_c1_g1_i1.p1 TRINITY_DN14474_c1_g1~~TRINITY_DN14474_c1_g1_i1.p1  ORF type:complete len:462 (-),score=11.34 TRINITY_DN14474_c1_g1_i1:173-1558(-)